MTTKGATTVSIGDRPGRHRAQDIDRHVGARIRERRIMLGLTQEQMSELIGVTYQQAHKYEKGINRITAGRLHHVAQALGVGVDYFFEGFANNNARPAFALTSQQRMLLELAQLFVALPSRKHQQAIAKLTKMLAAADGDA